MNNYQRQKVRIVRMNGCFGKPSYILLLDNNIQKRGLSALSALETSISLLLFFPVTYWRVVHHRQGQVKTRASRIPITHPPGWWRGFRGALLPYPLVDIKLRLVQPQCGSVY